MKVELFYVNAHVPNKTTLKQVEKCVVGRPQKQVVKLLSNKEIKQEVEVKSKK
jgi:hypothetical protein